MYKDFVAQKLYIVHILTSFLHPQAMSILQWSKARPSFPGPANFLPPTSQVTLVHHDGTGRITLLNHVELTL